MRRSRHPRPARCAHRSPLRGRGPLSTAPNRRHGRPNRHRRAWPGHTRLQVSNIGSKSSPFRISGSQQTNLPRARGRRLRLASDDGGQHEPRSGRFGITQSMIGIRPQAYDGSSLLPRREGPTPYGSATGGVRTNGKGGIVMPPLIRTPFAGKRYLRQRRRAAPSPSNAIPSTASDAGSGEWTGGGSASIAMSSSSRLFPSA